MSPLPRRSRIIYIRASSRIWFDKIVMNRNKSDDARYKFFFRMSRETVAYVLRCSTTSDSVLNWGSYKNIGYLNETIWLELSFHR